MKLSINSRRTLKLLCVFLAVGTASGGLVQAADEKPPALVVAADGSGDYRTVQAAVDAAPKNSNSPVVIEIRPGTYKEHIQVPRDKPFLVFRGTDVAATILTDDKNVLAKDSQGNALRTIDSSSTVLEGDDFAAENVTFENTAGNHGQALAIYVAADRCVFRKCRFLGWQDTVRFDPGRSYFDNCEIVGHVDFLYGDGTAFFERCRIHTLADGWLTAASTDERAPYGYVFRDCRVTADRNATRVFLGRPWRPYASVIFVRTELPAQIAAEGWHNWDNPENEKTARYAEYNSFGPGAKPSARVPWSKQLDQVQANLITVDKVLGGRDGWNPGPQERIALVGDSTVTDSAGWGGAFTRLLKGSVECINLARGGRASGSYVAEGSWQQCLDLKPDYVLIQFGHNDQPGHGSLHETDPKTSYRANMERYVTQARALRIKPIFVTSLTRQEFQEDGKIHSTLAPYAEVVKEIAEEMDVPLVDLHAMSIKLFESLGPEQCKAMAPRKPDGSYDGTHLTEKGAELVAPLVAAELRSVVPELARYVKSPQKAESE